METGKLGGSIRPSGLPRTGAFASWSPDGARVALFPGGDSLFVHSLAEGTTSLLAVAPEPFNHSPVWSPDGRRIAFVDGSFIFVATLQDISSSIWIVDVEDGDPVRVTSGEFVDFSPVWLDADHLLFTSNRDGPREAYVVEVGPSGPRGTPRRVAGLTDARTISYSAAGQTLAFAKASVRQNVWSYALGPATTSIADGQPVTTENAITRSHHVSPNGRWIAYSSDLGHTGNFDLYRRALDGGRPTLLAEGPLNEGDPQWSPDGSEIAYVVGRSRLLVVSADGATPIQVASASMVYRPTWSPTGLELAYICRQGAQARQLEMCVVSREAVGAAWGAAEQLTDFGCWSQVWTPDGSGVLCQVVDMAGGNYEPDAAAVVSRHGEVVWRYDPATDGLTLINGHLAFSEDGSIVYARAQRSDGTAGIWAIPVQGGEPRMVVAFDDDERVAQMWLAVRGDRLYLTVRQDESDIWVADVEVER
jgi:Tol biopolymer transport system component